MRPLKLCLHSPNACHKQEIYSLVVYWRRYPHNLRQPMWRIYLQYFADVFFKLLFDCNMNPIHTRKEVPLRALAVFRSVARDKITALPFSHHFNPTCKCKQLRYTSTCQMGFSEKCISTKNITKGNFIY